MKQQTRDLLLMLVIGAGIGVLGVYYWDNKSSELSEEVSSTPSGATTTALAENGPPVPNLEHVELPVPPTIPANTRVGLSVTDQPAGSTVTVTDLSVSLPSQWVAIYDEREGKPSWILGASRVRAGDTVTVVNLLRPTVAGATFYAAILNDDGDDTFNRLSDLPPMDPSKVVVIKFRATAQ